MKLSEILDVVETQRVVLKRQAQGLLRKALESLPDIQSYALVITGIRRCGKSTLLRQFVQKLGREFIYLSFDDLRFWDFSPSDYQLLDKIIEDAGCGLLFFDEIQSAPQWELYIRQKLDQGFQVLVTGSNASLLSRELGSRLTGRHISRELFPFSYGEYCQFTGQTPGAASLERYLEQGGFPEYLKTGSEELLAQLQTDIIYRDIAGRHGLRDASSLLRLYTYLVSNAAQLVSPSKLAPAVGVKSPTTILEYFSYFEASYLIALIPCFSWSAKAQSLAPKKLYIVDSGIIKTGSRSFTSNYGALLENFVFNSLRLQTSDIFYFADKTGECDFVINPHSVAPLCIQVCWELDTDNQDREIQGILAALDFFNRDEGVILTYNSRDLIIREGKRISVIPAWEYSYETV
ncbi:MAG: ATP-binding protein [Treponema sp.]|jgi:predicted AAA+ superfamily ATPase|nr:ATP-binding protein [Treponema sp.]